MRLRHSETIFFQLAPTQSDTWINRRESGVHRAHGMLRALVRGTLSRISQRGCDEHHNKWCRDKTMIAFGVFVFFAESSRQKCLE
jgi:hypothetical protein